MEWLTELTGINFGFTPTLSGPNSHYTDSAKYPNFEK